MKLKRYKNRKLYNTVQHKYVALNEIYVHLLQGGVVRCLDENDSDITNLILKQVLAKFKVYTTEQLIEMIRK